MAKLTDEQRAELSARLLKALEAFYASIAEFEAGMNAFLVADKRREQDDES